MPKFNTTQLVAFIKAHALTNYAKGWDVVVETYEDAQIAEVLGDATSKKAAVAAFADIVGVFNEQRDMHRNQALLMGAEPTETEIASGKVEELLGAPKPDLTDLEKAVIVALLESGIECNGCETLTDMQADNMCVADIAELAKRTGLTKAQLKGVISSLSSKGLVCANVEKVNGQPGVDQWLDTGALPLAFELLADGVKATAPKLPGEATAKQVKSVTVADAPAPKAERKARVLRPHVYCLPVEQAEQITALIDGSKKHRLAAALLKGATMKQLEVATGWKKAVVSSAFQYDMKNSGFGVERRDDQKYYLLMPAALKVLPVVVKGQKRPDAVVAACR